MHVCQPAAAVLRANQLDVYAATAEINENMRSNRQTQIALHMIVWYIPYICLYIGIRIRILVYICIHTYLTITEKVDHIDRLVIFSQHTHMVATIIFRRI